MGGIVGKAVGAIAKNVLPAPSPESKFGELFIKYLPKRGGEWVLDGAIVGAKHETTTGTQSNYYDRNVALKDIKPLLPSSGHLVSNEVIVYINGFGTDIEEQLESMQLLADKTGRPVIGIHNGTAGLVADGVQFVVDKLGSLAQELSGGKYTWNFDKASVTARRFIEAALEDGECFTIGTHSHGGLVDARAERMVEDKLFKQGLDQYRIDTTMSCFRRFTMGGAGRFYADGPQGNHFSMRGDPVPMLFGMRYPVANQPGNNSVAVTLDNNGTKPSFSIGNFHPLAAHSANNYIEQLPEDFDRPERFAKEQGIKLGPKLPKDEFHLVSERYK